VNKPKLKAVLDYAEQSKQWPDYAVQILLMKNKRGESVLAELLQVMDLFANETFVSRLIKFAVKSEKSSALRQELQKLKPGKEVSERSLKVIMAVAEAKEDTEQAKSSSLMRSLGFFKPLSANPVTELLRSLQENKLHNYDFLTKKAIANPESAALILQNPMLRDRLLNDAYEGGGGAKGGEITVNYVLSVIANSHPDSAKIILEDDLLRGKLLSGDIISKNHTLEKIARTHSTCANIKELCEKHRQVSIFRRWFG
jgi:hypothetical protein